MEIFLLLRVGNDVVMNSLKLQVFFAVMDCVVRWVQYLNSLTLYTL